MTAAATWIATGSRRDPQLMRPANRQTPLRGARDDDSADKLRVTAQVPETSLQVPDRGRAAPSPLSAQRRASERSRALPPQRPRSCFHPPAPGYLETLPALVRLPWR